MDTNAICAFMPLGDRTVVATFSSQGCEKQHQDGRNPGGAWGTPALKLALRRPRDENRQQRRWARPPCAQPRVAFKLGADKRERKEASGKHRGGRLGTIAHPDQFKKEEGKDSLYGLFTIVLKP